MHRVRSVFGGTAAFSTLSIRSLVWRSAARGFTIAHVSSNRRSRRPGLGRPASLVTGWRPPWRIGRGGRHRVRANPGHRAAGHRKRRERGSTLHRKSSSGHQSLTQPDLVGDAYGESGCFCLPPARGLLPPACARSPATQHSAGSWLYRREPRGPTTSPVAAGCWPPTRWGASRKRRVDR